VERRYGSFFDSSLAAFSEEEHKIDEKLI